MNKKQNFIFSICVIIIIIMGLFPPRENRNHRQSPFCFFLAPYTEIALEKLLVEWLLVIVSGSFLIYTLRNKTGHVSARGSQTKQDKQYDEPKKDQAKDISPFTLMLGLGEDCDEIPGAKGKFGFDPSNPIPVNGPKGETVYINRLRSKTGVGFLYHRIGSSECPINQKPIDEFELFSVDATQRIRLYFDAYHPRRSTISPEGLTLLSWSSLSKKERIFCKVNGMGITSGTVENFPIDLPKYIENNPELEQISPGISSALAKKTREIINAHKGLWQKPD